MTAMAVSPPPAVTLDPMNSRAVIALTGACYLFVGLGFSYLDRRFGSFGFEATLWAAWALLGFGAGLRHAGKPLPAGQKQWLALGLIGMGLALVLGLAMYSILRWAALSLMVVMGARAAVLRTRRDFHLTLSVVFVVSFMVGTHGNANWTLWFYLGPAWVMGGVALAWDNASGVPISRWAKLFMTAAFMALACFLASLLFFFAPRPPILGFGFLPPGTDTPGMFSQQGGGPGGTDASKGNGGAGASGSPQGAGTPSPGLGQQWRSMLGDMRKALSDRAIPQWQRSVMQTLLDAAQSALDAFATSESGASGPGQSAQQAGSSLQNAPWWQILLLLVMAFLLWRRRYRIGIACALALSWLLMARFPTQSMYLSASALKWCLFLGGHRRRRAQSVREHWAGATAIAPLARRWLGQAVEAYCAMRFGSVRATAQEARQMRRAVQGACDIVSGVAPGATR